MAICIEDLTEEKPDWRFSVTPKLTKSRPIHNWFIYPHSFDKYLVDELVNEFHLSNESCVWDPFLGAGTVALACKEKRIPVFGSDLLPLSLLISTAKTRNYIVENLEIAFSKINLYPTNLIEDRFAKVPIVEKSYEFEIRAFLSHLLSEIEHLNSEAQPFFLTALVSILGEVSRAVKSGGWLRIDNRREASIIDVRRIFTNKVEQMILDLKKQAQNLHFNNHTERVNLWTGDARFSRPAQKVDAVITSPPYLNRHDYTRVFALELSLISVSNAEELKNLRYRTLRSHVEAKAQMNCEDVKILGYKKPDSIDQAIEQMKKNNLVDARVPKMINGYFEDMFLVLNNIKETVNVGGKVALVLGDVRFSGVMIPVTEIICQIGDGLGLSVEKVYIARYRGNSAQQMGSFGRVKSKESVIVLRK